MESTKRDNSASASGRIIHHAFYPEECLLETIRQFSPFCQVTIINTNKDETIISIAAKETDRIKAEEVVGEFLNYLLNLSCRSILGIAHHTTMPQ